MGVPTMWLIAKIVVIVGLNNPPLPFCAPLAVCVARMVGIVPWADFREEVFHCLEIFSQAFFVISKFVGLQDLLIC
jgi:hypothetical protein